MWNVWKTFVSCWFPLMERRDFTHLTTLKCMWNIWKMCGVLCYSIFHSEMQKKKKKKTTICATLDVKRGRKQMNEGWFTFCLLRDKYHEKGRESVEQPDFTYLTALKCMRNIWKTWVPCFSIFHCKIRSKYCTCNVIF